MSHLRIEVQDQHFEVPLPDARVTIGTAPEADLRLTCDGVSKLHCRIEPLGDGRWRLRDLGSSRETLVNGVATKQVSLKPGDRIQVGVATIHFAVAAGAPVIPKAVAPKAVAPKTAAVSAVTPDAVPARSASAQPAAAPSSRKAPAAPADEAAHIPAAGPKSSARAEGGRKQKSRLLGPIVMLAAAAAAAFVLAHFLGQGETDPQALAEREYKSAVELLAAGKEDEARPILEQLARNGRAGIVRERAKRRLRHLSGVEHQAERELESLWSQRFDLTPATLAQQKSLFVEEYGPDSAVEFDAFAERVARAKQDWYTQFEQVADYEVKELLAAGQFDEALEYWRRFKTRAPSAIDVTELVAQGRLNVESAAKRGLDELLREGRRVVKRSGPVAATRYLQGLLPRYRGTAVEGQLRQSIKEFEALQPKPEPIPVPTPPTETPGTEPGPGPQPTPGIDFATLEATVARHVADWQYPKAMEAIRAVGPLPEGERTSVWNQRLEDLARADKAFVALIAHINDQPDRYRRIPITDRMKASLVKASRETLDAAVRGGSTRQKWSQSPKGMLAELARRRAAKGDEAVDLACLFRVRGDSENAETFLYKGGHTGADTAPLFTLLARWRGESIPEGGYVEHEERWVTPERRAFLLREARISELLVQVSDKKADKRQAAYKELFEIGEPAAARFQEQLATRRLALIDEIANSKSFKGSKYKTKLFSALKQRRAAALQLIYDASAYPYPNPGKKNQKNVEMLVDRVREVWERPFDLISAWDPKLKEELQVMTEVDEVLVRLDPDYRPDLDVLKKRINKSIDMPGFTPDSSSASGRTYSLKVMAFNESLDTTATEQEKDNTRAVNEYRMMMGLLAVKIEERLLRGARGHSKHMREKRYFAHNVPPPHANGTNRTPGIRAKVQGYGGGVGENIAMGPSTGRGAFWAWFGSSGHHRNMLGQRWTEMGCGRSRNYFTQLFGAAGGKSLSTPDKLPAPAAPFAPEPEGTPRRSGGGPSLPDEEGENGAFRDD